nr:hypothetical protein [Arthrobacter sp. U41]
MCNPLLSGADGGHDIHLRDLGRRGVRLHGHLEAADDGDLVFSDDLPEPPRVGRDAAYLAGHIAGR